MTAATLTGRRPHRRNRLGLVIHQVRYEQLSFWRNPQSAVFTFVFPVLFVAIMGALFGGVGKSSYFGGLTAGRGSGQPWPCRVTPWTLAWKVPEESVGSRVNQTST